MFASWSDEDQGKALAWQLEQLDRCPHCGTYGWQWGTADEPLHPYQADGYTCGGCEALAIERDRRKDDPESPGTRLVLYPKD